MRKKRVKIGWLKDRTVLYDYDTGKALKSFRLKEDSLEDFAFSLEGDIGDDRVVLHLPLISSKKSFWTRRRQEAIKVKVTVELI